MSIKGRIKLNDAIKVACQMYGYHYFERAGIVHLAGWNSTDRVKMDSEKQEIRKNVTEV